MKKILFLFLILLVAGACHKDAGLPPAPDFVFTPDVPCQAPCEVTFTSKSTNADSYEWDFDDGSPKESGEIVIHKYTTGRDYYVKLVAKSKSGGSQGITKAVKIKALPAALPVAKFEYAADNSSVTPSKVSFTNRSENTVRYEWDFGDNLATAANPNRSQDQNPVHSYTKEGEYTVTLTVYNGDNVSATTQQKIVIKPKAVVADFNITGGDCQAPCNVTFTDASQNAVTWLWDFGDGKTSTEKSPVHQYLSGGTYTVKLIATGADGVTKSEKTKTVTTIQSSFNAISIKGPFNIGRDIVADGSGNVYVCGMAVGQTDFGSGITSSAVGEGDIFVAKYDKTGKCLWAKMGGSASWDQALDITIDANNDIYITGELGGDLNSAFFSGVVGFGKLDAFVSKLSGSTGSVLWFKAIGGAGDDRGTGVAYSSADNKVHIAGSISVGGVSFDGNKFPADNEGDIYYTSVNASTGAISSPTRIIGVGSQSVGGLAVDNEGNAYICGTFTTQMFFDPVHTAKTLTSVGTPSDAYVAMWSKSKGIWQWASRISSDTKDTGVDLVVDNAKNVYVIGTNNHYLSEIQVNGGGNDNVFLGKWNSAGVPQWGVFGFNNDIDDMAGSIALAPSGNILVYGSFQRTGGFPITLSGGGTMKSAVGDWDVLVGEVNASNGTTTGFSKSFGGTLKDEAMGICVGSDGTIYGTGGFIGTTVFNGTSLTSTGSGTQNTFITKFPR